MKIAIYNPWTNSAETELEKRIAIAGEAIGYSVEIFRHNTDLHKADVDFAISLAFGHAKATRHKTFLTLWSPLRRFGKNPEYFKSICSFDGVAPGSEWMRDLITDLEVVTKKNLLLPKFLPTCYKSNFDLSNMADASLVYCGNNWDRRDDPEVSQLGRYVLDYLSSKSESDYGLSIYGPTNSWDSVVGIYRGSIPLDGVSSLPIYNKHGAILCLQSEFHYLENLPSMRLFDACAAGCVALSDDLPFISENFGDTVLYLDRYERSSSLSDQIATHMDWIKSNPATAREMAGEAQGIFNAKFSLEKYLSDLVQFVEEKGVTSSSTRHHPPLSEKAKCNEGYKHPSVELIVRVGESSIPSLLRTITSIVSQDYLGDLSIIFVAYDENPDPVILQIKNIMSNLDKHGEVSFEIVESFVAGKRKSNDYWAGLKAVKSKYFGILDSDDEISKNHVSSLVALLEDSADDVALAHAGTIRVWEGENLQWPSYHVYRDREISKKQFCGQDEDQYLLFFEPAEGKILFEGNCVGSGAWLAKRDFASRAISFDPHQQTNEDFAFIQMLLNKGKSIFSWQPTYFWYWDKSLSSNGTFTNTNANTRYFNAVRNRVRTSLVEVIRKELPLPPQPQTVVDDAIKAKRINFDSIEVDALKESPQDKEIEYKSDTYGSYASFELRAPVESLPTGSEVIFDESSVRSVITSEEKVYFNPFDKRKYRYISCILAISSSEDSENIVEPLSVVVRCQNNASTRGSALYSCTRVQEFAPRYPVSTWELNRNGWGYRESKSYPTVVARPGHAASLIFKSEDLGFRSFYCIFLTQGEVEMKALEEQVCFNSSAPLDSKKVTLLEEVDGSNLIMITFETDRPVEIVELAVHVKKSMNFGLINYGITAEKDPDLVAKNRDVPLRGVSPEKPSRRKVGAQLRKLSELKLIQRKQASDQKLPKVQEEGMAKRFDWSFVKSQRVFDRDVKWRSIFARLPLPKTVVNSTARVRLVFEDIVDPRAYQFAVERRPLLSHEIHLIAPGIVELPICLATALRKGCVDLEIGGFFGLSSDNLQSCAPTFRLDGFSSDTVDQAASKIVPRVLRNAIVEPVTLDNRFKEQLMPASNVLSWRVDPSLVRQDSIGIVSFATFDPDVNFEVRVDGKDMSSRVRKQGLRMVLDFNIDHRPNKPVLFYNIEVIVNKAEGNAKIWHNGLVIVKSQT